MKVLSLKRYIRRDKGDFVLNINIYVYGSNIIVNKTINLIH